MVNVLDIIIGVLFLLTSISIWSILTGGILGGIFNYFFLSILLFVLLILGTYSIITVGRDRDGLVTLFVMVGALIPIIITIIYLYIWISSIRVAGL